MKRCRKIPVYLLLITSLLSLSACGGKRPEATAVYVDKKGKLKQILVDPAPDYSVGDLQDYAEEKIAAYMKNSDGEVRLESCEEAEGVVYMELSYGSSADYQAFNGMDCFLGTLEEASQAGVMPADTLLAADGSAVEFSALLAEHPEYRILVLAENTLVQTGTEILGATVPATITGGNTAAIGDGDAGTSGFYPRKTAASAYIVFR